MTLKRLLFCGPRAVGRSWSRPLLLRPEPSRAAHCISWSATSARGGCLGQRSRSALNPPSQSAGRVPYLHAPI
jgi:hypothetical protein